MTIAGFQKLSLLDYPGTPCAIIFTQGCSFRCKFCHNPELIPPIGVTRIQEEEVLSSLRNHKNMVSAVTITGGEPTLQPDLIDFIQRLKNEGFLVKLDTNGISPHVVKNLFDRKLLDYVAMDIKQRWEKYPEVVQVDSPTIATNCRQTLALIQNSGIGHEFRTTILPGSHLPDDFMTMVGYLRAGEKYFIQECRFDVNLDPNLPHSTDFDLNALLLALRAARPELLIEKR